MRSIVVATAVALFFTSWVSRVTAQDIFEIQPVSRSIYVSASAGNAGEHIAHQLDIGPVFDKRSCAATATVNTWVGHDPWNGQQVTATGSVAIATEVWPWLVQISATSGFNSGYFTGVGSSFAGDASIVFIVPSNAKPEFAFSPNVGMASCGASLTGPSGQVWQGAGTWDMVSMSQTPAFLAPGQYTFSMHIQPQIMVGNGGGGGVTVSLNLTPAVPEPATIALVSLGLPLLTRRPRR